MLQKEVADRLVAKPSTHAYGYLTLYTQLFASAKILMTLEPKSFYPPPKVRSAVVVLDRAGNAHANPTSLLELISASFRMRRKKLTSNLLHLTSFSRDILIAAMIKAHVSSDARAEELSLAQFEALANELTGEAP